MGPIEKRIYDKINNEFSPLYLELENESHQHSVPKNSETHFRLVIVSAKFEGLSRINRQRLVHDVLKDEMGKGGVHALTQRPLTAAEWEAGKAASFQSPDCHGGSKLK